MKPHTLLLHTAITGAFLSGNVIAAPAPTSQDGQTLTSKPWTEEALSNQKTHYALDPNTAKKIEDLLSKMTLKEKVLQLASYYPNGNSRLKIPHMQAGECLHGVVAAKTTVFPQAIAMGSTWDPELIERMGTVVAKEARAIGIHHCYSPMLGLARDPRWGRADESYGEDPFLVSQIGTAYINGLQGTGKDRFSKDHILATAKHYVADGEPIAGDNGAAVELSERLLQETHLVPFRAVIRDAGVGGIMPAHHSYNGTPCHINEYLLTDVLRRQLGFDGLIVSDNNDIRRAGSDFHISNDMTDIIRMALENGIQTELAWKTPWGDKRVYSQPLIDAVKAGKIKESLVDSSVRKVLEYKFKLGLFDDPTAQNPANDLMGIAKKNGESEAYADTKKAAGTKRKNYKKVLYNDASNQLALEVAEKSIILLKNKNNLLPLDSSKVKTIAVIGPNADRLLFGGYSNKHPRYFSTILGGIKKYVPPTTKVLYAQGCDIHSPSTDGFAEAVKAAKASDVVVVVIGGDEKTIKENTDRDDITLYGPQRDLMKAVVAAGKPVVMVFLHGRALAIGWEKENVDAILDGWFLGQESGNAVARTLFGDNNPGGKLTVTYSRNTGQLPNYYNILPSGRPRRLFGSSPELLYPFGFGLSYTTFKLSDQQLSAEEMKASDTVQVSVKVSNTGKVKGDEVVQMYVHKKFCTLIQPALQLKGFKRITVEAGKSATVQIPITRSSLEIWKNGKWVVELGEYEIMIGTSSKKLKKLILTVK